MTAFLHAYLFRRPSWFRGIYPAIVFIGGINPAEPIRRVFSMTIIVIVSVGFLILVNSFVSVTLYCVSNPKVTANFGNPSS